VCHGVRALTKVFMYREVESELWNVNADSGILYGEVERLSWSGSMG